MKLLEYEGKKILAKYSIPVPRSYVADGGAEFLPAVLKSQVPVGGRGKAGGIKVVKGNDEYEEAYKNILGLEIKGYKPRTILAEELLEIDRELYLSLMLDTATYSVILMAHTRGGVEVEDNDASDFLRVALSSKNLSEVGLQLSEYYDAPEVEFTLQYLVKNLFEAFNKEDATLIEINPLVITKDDKLVAGDAKVVLDDSAAFRHPEWKFEEGKTDSNFVTLDIDGTVATIANGAGLAMATVDAVADSALSPANFLDVGGGANEASVLAAFERIMDYPHVRVIVINIFAGITRCDEVAKAIIAARKQISNLPPLVIRLAGTNFEAAAELLENEDIALHPSLPSAIRAAQEVAS